jgi:C_GCAxxG_C_C family probable redox protein
MNRSDKAIGYFRNKFNCSQSVFTAFGTEHGLSEDACLKISCPFGAGMGRQQFTCGAVTGALMALGLKYGKAMGDPDEKKQLTYEKTREFFKEFTGRHGTTSCRELLKGLDINDPGDHQKIMEQGLFDTACETYVRDSVRIVELISMKEHGG